MDNEQADFANAVSTHSRLKAAAGRRRRNAQIRQFQHTAA